MGTYPARAIIRCHADSFPSSPPESNNVSSDGIFLCPSVVRIMGIFYQMNQHMQQLSQATQKNTHMQNILQKLTSKVTNLQNQLNNAPQPIQKHPG